MDRKVFLPLIGLLIFSFQAVWAFSPDSLRLETIDGQTYVIHQVDPGETLYSISKRYRASMNAIADTNPEVINGLEDGMIIKVPYCMLAFSSALCNTKRIESSSSMIQI